MKKKDLVSVVIPIYNTEKYLVRCLDSVVTQTWIDLEIILLDDGSTDSSLKICHSYASQDDRIIIIEKQNTGISDTREIGVQRATGKWIAFLDSDDWYHKSFIEQMVNACRKYKTDVAFCRFYEVYGKEKFIYPSAETRSILSGAEAIYNILLPNTVGYFTSLWNKLYCLELIKKENIHFNRKLHVGEDELWLVQLLKKCDSVICINSPLYYYRNRKESLSRSSILSLKKISNIECKKLVIQETFDLPIHIKKISEARYYSVCISLLLQSKNHSDLKFIKEKIDWTYWKKYRKSFLKDNNTSVRHRCFFLLSELFISMNLCFLIKLIIKILKFWQYIKFKLKHCFRWNK